MLQYRFAGRNEHILHPVPGNVNRNSIDTRHLIAYPASMLPLTAAAQSIGVSRQYLHRMCRAGRVIGATYDPAFRRWSIPHPVQITTHKRR